MFKGIENTAKKKKKSHSYQSHYYQLPLLPPIWAKEQTIIIIIAIFIFFFFLFFFFFFLHRPSLSHCNHPETLSTLLPKSQPPPKPPLSTSHYIHMSRATKTNLIIIKPLSTYSFHSSHPPPITHTSVLSLRTFILSKPWSQATTTTIIISHKKSHKQPPDYNLSPPLNHHQLTLKH